MANIKVDGRGNALIGNFNNLLLNSHPTEIWEVVGTINSTETADWYFLEYDQFDFSNYDYKIEISGVAGAGDIDKRFAFVDSNTNNLMRYGLTYLSARVIAAGVQGNNEQLSGTGWVYRNDDFDTIHLMDAAGAPNKIFSSEIILHAIQVNNSKYDISFKTFSFIPNAGYERQFINTGIIYGDNIVNSNIKGIWVGQKFDPSAAEGHFPTIVTLSRKKRGVAL